MKLLVFTDLHFHNHKMFARPYRKGLNTRAVKIVDVLLQIIELSRDFDAVLFCGDFFEIRDSVPVSIALKAKELVSKLAKEVPVIMIGGNHDSSTTGPDSPNAIHLFEDIFNVHVLGSGKPVSIKDVDFYGFHAQEPLSSIKSVNKAKSRQRILLLHVTLRGAILSGNFRSSEGMSLQRLLQFLKENKIDKCFIGDLHKRQTLADKVLYVGSPLQKRFDEEGDDKGVLSYCTSSKSVEFIKLKSPVFRTLTFQQVTPNIKLDDFNYFRIVTETSEEFAELQAQQKWNFMVLPPQLKRIKNRSEITLDTSYEQAYSKWLQAKFVEVSEERLNYLYTLGKAYIE